MNDKEKYCKKFVSKETMRHYLAVLIQANRWRRDMHVPAIYKMPDPAELGKAIDFAVSYIKKQNEEDYGKKEIE